MVVSGSSRGTGTSGYVQLNLSQPKDKHPKNDSYESRQQAKRTRQLREEVELNERAKKQARGSGLRDEMRNIEVSCMDLRVKLEDLSEDEEVIEQKVSELRTRLSANEGKGSINLESVPSNDKKLQQSKATNKLGADKYIQPELQLPPKELETSVFEYKPRYNNKK